MAIAAGVVLVGLLVGPVGARQTALPVGNLVQNPGAEAGHAVVGTSAAGKQQLPAWVTTDGAGVEGVSLVAARYGSHGYFPSKKVSATIGGGKNFFFGGYPNKGAIATQTIDVSGAGPEIDAGGVRACLSAYIGGTRNWKGYNLRIELTLLGEDESPLGRLRIGPVTPGQRGDETGLVRRAAGTLVPRGTRLLRVVIAADGGRPLYTFADNVSVALTKGACDPVLTVKCVKKALVATVIPSTVAPTQRVRFAVKGGKRTKQASDARAPYSTRFTMNGFTGRLAVTATVVQKGAGTITLSKKSRRC